MSKKKFKDTKVGKFLSGAGSSIIDSFGDVLPDKGVMGVVKNLIKKDPILPAEDKEKALALLQQDTIEMQEVSKRWASDMQSDSWLSKNTRPLALIFLTISMVVLIFVDSTGVWFDVIISLLLPYLTALFEVEQLTINPPLLILDGEW